MLSYFVRLRYKHPVAHAVFVMGVGLNYFARTKKNPKNFRELLICFFVFFPSKKKSGDLLVFLIIRQFFFDNSLSDKTDDLFILLIALKFFAFTFFFGGGWHFFQKKLHGKKYVFQLFGGLYPLLAPTLALEAGL